jgi:hypothetical protein
LGFLFKHFFPPFSEAAHTLTGSSLGVTSLAFNGYQQWKKLEISIKGAQN